MSPDRRDDEDRFDRPRRHTRPRTKERPTYPDAVDGLVVTVDRGRFRVFVDDGGDGVEVFAVKARPLGRKGVVVGDEVRVVGDVSGTPDTLARIVEVRERRTVLRRSADDGDDGDAVERVIVANAEQLVIVCAVADPPPRHRLIDRCLVAAYDAGMTPLLCVTKTDLASPQELLDIYGPLDVEVVSTRRGGDLDAVRGVLAARSVLVGHSGWGSRRS